MEEELVHILQLINAKVVLTRHDNEAITNKSQNIKDNHNIVRPSKHAPAKHTIDIFVKEEDQIYNSLFILSPSLGSGYAQVKTDLLDERRLSWAGTAHEIREVLATMLRILAPDEHVPSQAWYKQEPNTSGPTQKQRVRYILQENGAGSKESEVVEQVINLEDMIGNLVRATYSRASDAAHRNKAKREVLRIVKYFDAFAYDLLNL